MNTSATRNETTAALSAVRALAKGRVPGQLIIQVTSRCNARCPQCGMRVGSSHPRGTLPADDVKRMLDAAAEKGIRVVSFTGGEPLLDVDRLTELIRHAGKAGIPFIRTGTNGFLFADTGRGGSDRRIHTLAEKLASTPLRNFWISIDSADPRVHERMRGFPGVVAGIEKALPVFHAHGIYPSVNLGVNRNVGGRLTAGLDPARFTDNRAYGEAFYRAFQSALRAFYRFVIDLGFTMVNTCYPMSIGDTETAGGLRPVYAATAVENVVRFSRAEKSLLFAALLKTVPEFRPAIRVFSPLCALHALRRHYAGRPSGGAYPCRGGIDFFFVDANDGNTYPCGYRGGENLGRFWDFDPASAAANPGCDLCDWECFRDPSELFGPLLEAFRRPLAAARWLFCHRRWRRLWLSDLRYYRACAFFDGRTPMDTRRLAAFDRPAAD